MFFCDLKIAAAEILLQLMWLFTSLESVSADK